jgi:hypothetical protein
MLTENGYRDRFWRGYPHLRQFLEPKAGSIPHGVDLLGFVDDDEPRISTDHGPIGRLADVIAIARLLTAERSDVIDVMGRDAASSEKITEEVNRLIDELVGRLDAFRHALARASSREIEVARITAREVEELGLRLLSETQMRDRSTDGRDET